jgi:DNA-binding MarR family transcriptional regulator
MAKEAAFEHYYLALIEFLLLSKRCVIDIGASYKLTPMQSMSLLLLGEPRPMNSFSDVFHCDASNVTGIVDGLERKHLVSRFEHPDDRRIKMVQLEDKGAQVRAHFIRQLTGDKSYILTKLSESELSQFIKLLTKITAKPA